MNNQSNMGKQIKDLGMLIIIVGAIMAAIIILGLVSGNENSFFYIIMYKHFLFLVVGSLLCFLSGIIVRSIGKTKEQKQTNQQQRLNNQQPH
ncbi:MAG: hypothetical protein J6I46_02890 [Ruminococcus sp.]|nr:hypothetical protein [Ruminococcus sp.]